MVNCNATWCTFESTTPPALPVADPLVVIGQNSSVAGTVCVWVCVCVLDAPVSLSACVYVCVCVCMYVCSYICA